MLPLVFLAFLGFADPPPSRLAVIRPAPAIKLIDTNDQPVSLDKLKGKVVLVAFFFTTCNGTCPATTHRLSKIQEKVGKHAALKDRVHILSVTIDPERDTPERLRGYQRLYDIDAGSWSFLTGPAADIRRTLDAWDTWAKPAANGQLDHPSRVYLVDPESRIREIYNLEFLRPAWVVDDVRLLLSELK